MRTGGRFEATGFAEVVHEIKTSDLSDAEKLAQVFGYSTSRIIEHGEHQVELARAMKDTQVLVKEQIKVSVMEHARSVFNDCYKMLFGKDAWDE
jgi:hypothetical protein